MYNYVNLISNLLFLIKGKSLHSGPYQNENVFLIILERLYELIETRKTLFGKHFGHILIRNGDNEDNKRTGIYVHKKYA